VEGDVERDEGIITTVYDGLHALAKYGYGGKHVVFVKPSQL
jgi:hypothetical protein